MTLIHATCVEFEGTGVLLRGPSGAGKSDLALRMIDAGWALVADDQVDLAVVGGRLEATPPRALAGLLEVRGIGLVRLPHRDRSFVGLVAELDPAAPIERMPTAGDIEILGVTVALVALRAFEASAPAKLRLVARGLDLHSDAEAMPYRRRQPR